MACHVGRIPARCTLCLTGCRLSHPAENIYKSYCCVQILTIPAADFIGWATTFGSAGPSTPHDLNVYPHSLWHVIAGNRNCLKPAYVIVALANKPTLSSNHLGPWPPTLVLTSPSAVLMSLLGSETSVSSEAMWNSSVSLSGAALVGGICLDDAYGGWCCILTTASQSLLVLAPNTWCLYFSSTIIAFPE